MHPAQGLDSDQLWHELAPVPLQICTCMEKMLRDAKGSLC